jgi:hypothetical protein
VLDAADGGWLDASEELSTGKFASAANAVGSPLMTFWTVDCAKLDTDRLALFFWTFEVVVNDGGLTLSESGGHGHSEAREDELTVSGKEDGQTYILG